MDPAWLSIANEQEIMLGNSKSISNNKFFLTCGIYGMIYPV